MKLSDKSNNCILVKFISVSGFKKSNIFSPSQMSHENYGQQMILRLDAKDSFSFVDIDDDSHTLTRYKDGYQSVLFYNDYFIYDASEFTVSDHEIKQI